MHGFVEETVLTENEKDNESHVDVMGILLLGSIQDLQDGHNLHQHKIRLRFLGEHTCKLHPFLSQSSDKIGGGCRPMIPNAFYTNFQKEAFAHFNGVHNKICTLYQLSQMLLDYYKIIQVNNIKKKIYYS